MVIHYLDSKEWQKLETDARMKRESLSKHVNKKDEGAVLRLQLDDEPDLGPKEFGPMAVYDSSRLGNYEPKLAYQSGPGERGEPVHIAPDEQQKADRSIREYGFNMVASDKIAMNRTIPDLRMSECKHWQYPEKLPTASVIIVFHNEGFSTLLRTVHSVINTSPSRLLHEVVMVDDYSEKDHLKSQLEEYIKQFNGKVKLYRNPERYGLIRTRTEGAKYATGDVIVFLDAHCECQPNWLPPLLSRIAYDRTIMAVPIIDGIDWNNFHYSSVYQSGMHFRGIFEWGFLYKESEVPQTVLNKRQHDSEPYKAPTHAGGLFAMDRKYFFQLGAYDPGLQIWGGENFELSFKIWQCGGSVEWVPCSKVGHVYRNHMPYGFGKISAKIPIILINYMRVVEVWLDEEYREYFYTREPTIRGYPIGDIEDQIRFKKQHKCRSFKWFLENVAMEVVEKFPFPPPNLGWGEIKLRHDNVCVDNKGQGVNGGAIGVYSCHHLGGSQLYRLNVKGQWSSGERCIESTDHSFLYIIVCPVNPTGPWEYDKEFGHIRDSRSKKCCTADPVQGTLSLQACSNTDNNQKFDINKIKVW